MNLLLYRSTTRFYSPRDANGPDECSIDRVRSVSGCALVKAEQVKNCQEQKGQIVLPAKQFPAIGRAASEFVFFLADFFTQGQGRVPFYFQPTLGGGDINGNPSLSRTIGSGLRT